MTSNRLVTYFDCLEEFAIRDKALPWRVRENTNIWYSQVGFGQFVVELYGSAIATMYSDGTVKLDRCGFKSFTTRNRMNDVLVPLGYRIKIQNEEWNLVRITDGGMIPFSDNMTVRPIPGSPITQQINNNR